MAVRRLRQGRLIAVDGGSGPAVAAAAKSLSRALRGANTHGGLSPWDSSGIFTELAAAEGGIPGPSARTLTLLYAADLAFRVRWQIGPAIEAGHSVVAAPYVESAKALGIAAGLPRRWLDHLFRFAPKPDICYHVSERGARAARRTPEGYAECFANALAASGGAVDPAELRSRCVQYLTALERRGRCSRLATPAAAAVQKRARRR